MCEYTVVIMEDGQWDGETGPCFWVAYYPSVPPCMGQGYTPEQAESDLRNCLDDWREWMAEDGEEMPPPDVPLMRAIIYGGD